nr:hypothetical protein GCM10023233_03250 [Brevibacterium otitidis]
MGWFSQVGFHAVGEGHSKLGQGLFPVRGLLALDEPSGGFALVGGFAAFFGAFTGSFVLDRPGYGGGFDLTERIGTCLHRVSTLQKFVTVLCVWSMRS